jgi:hypothetical protein
LTSFVDGPDTVTCEVTRQPAPGNPGRLFFAYRDVGTSWSAGMRGSDAPTGMYDCRDAGGRAMQEQLPRYIVERRE